MKPDVTVAAVVVTYNRVNLLRQCLRALEIQQGLTTVFVVDNASTDSTREMLSREFPAVTVIALEKNLGGAGGFHEGIKWAYLEGYDWIWVMDDDTAVGPGALEKLLEATMTVTPAPVLVASVVKWTDGSLHVMNIPQFRTTRINPDIIIEHVSQRVVPIRQASFVSTMIARKAVQSSGLPITDYFIWADDIEYTARILKHSYGVWVLDSCVIHQTSTNYVPHSTSGARYFFHLRNYIWILRFSDAYDRSEKARLLFSVVVGTVRYLGKQRFNGSSTWNVLKAFVMGITTRPRNVVTSLL